MDAVSFNSLLASRRSASSDLRGEPASHGRSTDSQFEWRFRDENLAPVGSGICQELRIDGAKNAKRLAIQFIEGASLVMRQLVKGNLGNILVDRKSPTCEDLSDPPEYAGEVGKASGAEGFKGIGNVLSPTVQ